MSALRPARCTSSLMIPGRVIASRWLHGSHSSTPTHSTSPTRNRLPTSAFKSTPRTVSWRRVPPGSSPADSTFSASTSVSACPAGAPSGWKCRSPSSPWPATAVTDSTVQSSGTRSLPRWIASTATNRSCPTIDLVKVEAMEVEGRKVYSVRAFNSGVARYLNKLPTLWIEGEVTELRRQQRWASVFFTLKDPEDGACLPVQMPRGQFDALDLNLAEGERVHVFGRVELYEQRGELRLKALTIERFGLGVRRPDRLRGRARAGHAALRPRRRRARVDPDGGRAPRGPRHRRAARTACPRARRSAPRRAQRGAAARPAARSDARAPAPSAPARPGAQARAARHPPRQARDALPHRDPRARLCDRPPRDRKSVV